MYRWIARQLVKASLRKHVAGDVDGLLKMYADDVRFVFPGDSSWSGERVGKQAIGDWLRRFHRVGLELDVNDVLVDGPPWNTRVCLRFTDVARDADGEVVYENQGVIYGRAAWGKITYYEVCEDTQKLAAFDEYLATHERA